MSAILGVTNKSGYQQLAAQRPATPPPVVVVAVDALSQLDARTAAPVVPTTAIIARANPPISDKTLVIRTLFVLCVYLTCVAGLVAGGAVEYSDNNDLGMFLIFLGAGVCAVPCVIGARR